jgi:glycosyltransferase involved in cell wall biosynthesis
LNKILFIGAINLSNSPKGGEEYKNQLILEKLVNSAIIRTSAIDTYQWKSKPLLIAKLLLSLLFQKFDLIVISASSASTFQLLKFIYFLKPSNLKKAHYFVIGGYFPEGIRSKRYDWKIYKNLKSVVVEGRILKDQLLECSELNNIQVISNFKKFEYKGSLKEKPLTSFKFVFVGRISKAKGILEIIEASDILKANNPSLDFEVDFYGPMEESIEFPKNLPITYNGYLDIMNNPEASYTALSEYSCMLFPTYWMGEGFPGVIIDAYIAGLPVITTDWNMNKEVVENGKTGIIIPIKDAKTLASAMLKMIENPYMVARMSQNSLNKAKDFHIDAVWPKIVELII